MSFVRVGSLGEFPADSVRQVVASGQTVALCRVGAEFHAVDGICPHHGGPLGHGALHGTTLVCPYHAWEFDCITGGYDRNPELKLRRFEVKVEGDQVFVDAGAA